MQEATVIMSPHSSHIQAKSQKPAEGMSTLKILFVVVAVLMGFYFFALRTLYSPTRGEELSLELQQVQQLKARADTLWRAARVRGKARFWKKYNISGQLRRAVNSLDDCEQDFFNKDYQVSIYGRGVKAILELPPK